MKYIFSGIFYLALISSTFADNSVQVDNFIKQLNAYAEKNIKYQQIIKNFSGIKSPTEEQKITYFKTICSYEKNLERAEKLFQTIQNMDYMLMEIFYLPFKMSWILQRV